MECDEGKSPAVLQNCKFGAVTAPQNSHFPLPTMSLTLAHDAPCEFWRIKWNESHTRWRMKPHHHSMLNFIHVPKAAGHTVEEALTRAFTGASEGTSGTTDGHNFQAGHHTYTERLNHHGGKSQDFITVLREPLSRLVSRYNDVHNMLSEPSFCAVSGKAFWPKVKGGISIRTAAHSMQPSYCFTAYMGACKPGTGWNLVAMAEQNHNGSAPCVPALSFLEWLDCPAKATTAGSSHWCAPIDEARHYIHPMAFDFPKSDPKLEEDLADELRKHYLLVGTLAKQGTVNHSEKARVAGRPAIQAGHTEFSGRLNAHSNNANGICALLAQAADRGRSASAQDRL